MTQFSLRRLNQCIYHQKTLRKEALSSQVYSGLSFNHYVLSENEDDLLPQYESQPLGGTTHCSSFSRSSLRDLNAKTGRQHTLAYFSSLLSLGNTGCSLC